MLYRLEYCIISLPCIGVLTHCSYFNKHLLVLADLKLKEMKADDKQVAKILLQVGVARREAEIVSYL